MVKTVTIGDAQHRLGHLIHEIGPGDEVLVSEYGYPVARIIRIEQRPELQSNQGQQRKPHTIVRVSKDIGRVHEEFLDSVFERFEV